MQSRGTIHLLSSRTGLEKASWSRDNKKSEGTGGMNSEQKTCYRINAVNVCVRIQENLNHVCTSLPGRIHQSSEAFLLPCEQQKKE